MSTGLETAPVSLKRSWQFNLGGMFVLLLGFAAAFAEWRWLGGEWGAATNAARTGISVWLAIGLLHQARDFWRDRSTDHQPGERFGLAFAIGWRLAIVAMLAGYHVLAHFDSKLFLGQDDAWLAGWPIDALYYLSLVVIISSTRQLTARRKRKPTTLWRGAAAWISGAVYCSFMLHSALTIHFLVYVAICGIEFAHSPITNPFIEGLDPSITGRAEPVFWWGCIAALLVPLVFSALYLALRAKSSRGRWMLASLWVVLFAAISGILGWLCLVGLPNVSPLMWEQEIVGNAWHFGLIAVPCVLILTLAAACRWSAVDSKVSAQVPVPTNPSRPRFYLHEQPLLLLLIGGMFATDLSLAVAKNWDVISWDGLAYLFLYDFSLPFIAATIIALQAAYRGWRHKEQSPPRPPLVPPAQFAIAALAFGVSFVIAIPVLAIYGFALWLAQWYLPYLSAP